MTTTGEVFSSWTLVQEFNHHCHSSQCPDNSPATTTPSSRKKRSWGPTSHLPTHAHWTQLGSRKCVLTGQKLTFPAETRTTSLQTDLVPWSNSYLRHHHWNNGSLVWCYGWGIWTNKAEIHWPCYQSKGTRVQCKSATSWGGVKGLCSQFHHKAPERSRS